MNCIAFEHLIALYVEGDLLERKAQRVENHLNTCLACQDFATGLKESQSALKSLGRESVDATVFQKIRERVLNQITSQQALRHRTDWLTFLQGWRWRYALIGGLIVLLGAVVLLRLQSPEVPRPDVAKSSKEHEGVAGAVRAPTDALPVNIPEGFRAKNLSPQSRRSLQRPIHRGPETAPTIVSEGQGPSELHVETVSPGFEISRIKPLQIEPVKIEPPATSHQLVIKLVSDDPEIVIIWLVDQKQNGG